VCNVDGETSGSWATSIKKEAGHVDGDTSDVNHVVCNGETSYMAPMDVKNETQVNGEVCEKQGWNTNVDGGTSGRVCAGTKFGHGAGCDEKQGLYTNVDGGTSGRVCAGTKFGHAAGCDEKQGLNISVDGGTSGRVCADTKFGHAAGCDEKQGLNISVDGGTSGRVCAGTKFGHGAGCDEKQGLNTNVDGGTSGRVCAGTKFGHAAGCDEKQGLKTNVDGGTSGRVCAGTKFGHGVRFDDLRASENWKTDDSVKPRGIADMWAAETKAQGACSQVHSPEMTINLLFNTEPGVGERRNTKVPDWAPQKEDPNYPVVWGAEDDMLVRKTAGRLVSKKWEVLKLCKNVIDEQASMLNEMKLKEKIKENVCWNDEDERKYCEWKIKNVKYMSLKESKLKENVRLNVFEHFCER
jgi:hypothetical protein